MRISNVLFDLDGTLTDSLPGIEASAATAIASVLPGTRMPPLREFVGPPIRVVLQAALPQVGPRQLDALVSAFRRTYDEDGWRLTRLFSGVAETLNRLHVMGKRLFVVTNKPAIPSLRMLEYLDLQRFFDDVVSPDSREPAFVTKTEMTRHILSKHALCALETVLVGDSDDDRLAAHSCELTFALAAYGYAQRYAPLGSSRALTLAQPADMLEFVDE